MPTKEEWGGDTEDWAAEAAPAAVAAPAAAIAAPAAAAFQVKTKLSSNFNSYGSGSVSVLGTIFKVARR